MPFVPMDYYCMIVAAALSAFMIRDLPETRMFFDLVVSAACFRLTNISRLRPCCPIFLLIYAFRRGSTIFVQRGNFGGSVSKGILGNIVCACRAYYRGLLKARMVFFKISLFSRGRLLFLWLWGGS